MTAIKERPILFSGPMVRAILDGRKTQTRRTLERVIGFTKALHFGASDTPGYDFCFRCQRGLWQEFRSHELLSRCPYGVAGDRLWVRERWKQFQVSEAVLRAVCRSIGVMQFTEPLPVMAGSIQEAIEKLWKIFMSTAPTGVEARVCKDIAARQQAGIAKYGVEVEHNPLRLREWLQHAYEECLDQAVYLRAAIERLEQERPNVGDVGEAIQALRAAGLDAWDDIDDPEQLIREMRGEGPS